MVPKTRVLESSSKNRTLWDATKSLCLFTSSILGINQDIFSRYDPRYCWITKIQVVNFIKGTVMKYCFTFFLIFLYFFESILLRLYDFIEFHRIDIKFSEMNSLCWRCAIHILSTPVNFTHQLAINCSRHFTILQNCTAAKRQFVEIWNVGVQLKANCTRNHSILFEMNIVRIGSDVQG